MYNTENLTINSFSLRQSNREMSRKLQRFAPENLSHVISDEFSHELAVLPSLKLTHTIDWRIILSVLALTLLMASHGIAAPASTLTPAVSSTPTHLPVGKFAQREITKYEEVISAATERTENESDPQRVARMSQQLKKITKEMDQAKKAEAQWKKEASGKREPFARENLKESIEALQDSGTRLIEEMIAADRQDGLYPGTSLDTPASERTLEAPASDRRLDAPASDQAPELEPSNQRSIPHPGPGAVPCTSPVIDLRGDQRLVNQ